VSDDSITIYALVDPRDGAYKYIGQTDNVARRRREHIASPHSQLIAEWVRELAPAGMEPDAVALEQCERSLANSAEARWLAQHAGRLLNSGRAGAGRRAVGSGCRTGRPSINVLKVRLTDTERAQLDAYVAKHGRDRSHWVRLAMVGAGLLRRLKGAK
jgi:hypothetical protein